MQNPDKTGLIPQSRPDLQAQDFDYIPRIIESRQVAQGPFVEALEQAFSQITQVRHTIAVSNGTAALHLALLALEVGRGDEVILPSYVCAALLYAVQYVGARPILVDIDPETLNPAVERVAQRITRRTKAIITTHTFGFPSAVADLVRLGVPVIEDCAQALGAEVAGRPVGSFGTMAVYSLYATKVICAGEGGIVTTNNRRLAQRLRDLTMPDQRANYRLRYNYKMSDLTAGLALHQLRRLDQMIARRRTIADRYSKALADSPIILQKVLPDTKPIYYRYVIRCPRAPRIIRESRAQGIACDRPVFRPLHRYLGTRPAMYQETDRVWRSAVSVPLYPALTEAEVQHIIAVMPRLLG